jgi:hypothetical protein
MKWWRTRVTLPAWPACKAGLDPCPFPDWYSKRCSVGWAKSHRAASTRGQGAHAILPTRPGREIAPCPPYQAVPDLGAQGRFRAHLSAASTQRFHQISFLGELERPEGIDPSSQRWHRYALPLSYGRMVGVARIRTCTAQRRRVTTGWVFPFLVAGPRVERGAERLMRPPGPPGLPANEKRSHEARNGGELRCRSPHRAVRIVFETSSAAGPISSPCIWLSRGDSNARPLASDASALVH